MPKREEAYIVTDVEIDGPQPGRNSLLSIGAVAMSDEGEVLDKFTVNLEPLSYAKPDPATQKWWSKQSPDVYKAARENAKPAEIAIAQFCEWSKSFDRNPVLVSFPGGVDFMWIYWYCYEFLGQCPFGLSGIDMKTMAMVLLKRPYRDSSKDSWPDLWFHPDQKHTHIALPDAIEQAYSFHRMMDTIKGWPKPGLIKKSIEELSELIDEACKYMMTESSRTYFRDRVEAIRKKLEQ